MPYSKEYMLNLTKEFVHLHVHSEYSNLRLLDSINKIPKMIKHVASLGQNALALTDHESLSGHVKFIKEANEMKNKGEIPQDFKVILGNEIYLVDKDEMYKDMKDKEKNPKFYHFLLLAKDKKGHEILKKLSSKAWGRMFSYKGMERVPTFYSDVEDIIGENTGHIIASTACLGSYFAQRIMELSKEENEDEKIKIKYKIHDFINWCISVFGKDDFYIEIQPAKVIEQIEYNKMAVKIAKAYGLKHIITTDAHYLTPQDRNIHKAYLTSDKDESGSREVDDFYSSTHFFTSETLFDYMNYLNKDDVIEGIANTKRIADKCKNYDLSHKQIIPKIKLPNEDNWFIDKELYDIAKQYEHINYMMNSSEVYDRYLISQTLKGVKEQIQKADYKETFERINIECKEIIGSSKAKEEPLSSYFITMQKNIDIIWDEAESIVGVGRGSAGGFIIDYLLEITQVNPLKQGIEMPHWRFISAERPDLPDIDIDVPSHKRNIVFQCIQSYYESIGGTIVRVCTFGTETAKSAILTACRGLGVNNDIGLYLSSLIKVERGQVWSIEDCYYGNPEKNREPITEFKNMVDNHEGLLNVALGIQGLINKRSSHACGVVIVNEDFTKYNAIMRTPSGEIVSQFNLEDSEYVGNIKYDFLNTKTCSMIQKTLEMLIEHNKIVYQGNLRKTYKKYLHPDVIDKDTKEMWDLLNDGSLISAFQFDSAVGEQALKAIRPTNLLEATNANNLMRLMVEDGREQPLEMYVRYKNNINEWYSDMNKFGLSEKEIKIMENHLLKDYGVCSTQEGMMMLSMDKDIAGFNVVESNTLRKGVAKKRGEAYEKAHKLLYKKGIDKNTSKTLLDYVWDIQIAMQKGYGFSLLHGIEYTYILIQQLNLIYYYPSIYWNTAVLLVESGALELESNDDTNEDDDNEDNSKEKTTNYGTVAKAIGNMQDKGVKISLPDINKADVGFKPYEETNEIVFGLKGIMKMNNETSRLIMEHRPFNSVNDFYKRMVLTKREITQSTGKKQMQSLVPNGKMLMLLKAGAFDKLENKPREEILEDYVKLLNPPKKALTGKAIESVLNMGIVPSGLKEEIRLYKFREYIKNNNNIQDEETKSIKWHSLQGNTDKLTEYAMTFFNENFLVDMTEDRGYRYDENGVLWVALGTKRKGSFDDIYSKKIAKFTQWLNSKECLNLYNDITFNNIKNEIMQGNISTWEMESMNFYYHEHELAHIDKDKYTISNYNDLPEEAEVVGFTEYNGVQYPKFKLYRIIGTVLDRDKNKHTVTLLTPDGVVSVKFYSGQFAFYDKTISRINGDGSKTKLEDGWFKRGNKIIVTGYRRGDQFKPKKYKDSVYNHTVQKIVDIKDNGDLVLQSERVRED